MKTRLVCVVVVAVVRIGATTIDSSVLFVVNDDGRMGNADDTTMAVV